MSSVFRNVRIYPRHGSRSATITWELEEGTPAGDVYVAFSTAGTRGTWKAVNPTAPVPSELEMFQDTGLFMDAGTVDGFYRLMLVTDADDEFVSEPFQIAGDMTAREYGILRAMIRQEFLQMRVTNGFPVWHCIPKTHGIPANNIDPDTDLSQGEECAEADPALQSYGMPFQGGFYPPVLTWMRVIAHAEGLQDDPEEFSPSETDQTSVRLMCFPRPRRGHMIVDPTTDRRYLVSQEIKPYRLRGVMPVAYNATLDFLSQGDERYKFAMPNIDTKAYRRIPYWNPGTLLTPTPDPVEP
jgi:hypothetical protein